MVVDHNHETGQIRGLLCSNCNLGLGHFRDSISNLARAIFHLENPCTKWTVKQSRMRPSSPSSK